MRKMGYESHFLYEALRDMQKFWVILTPITNAYRAALGLPLLPTFNDQLLVRVKWMDDHWKKAVEVHYNLLQMSL